MDGLSMKPGATWGRRFYARQESCPRLAHSALLGFSIARVRARVVVSIFLDTHQRIFRLMSDGGKWSAVYDRFAANYDRMMRPLERVGLSRLRARALAEVPEGSRVLEVGAGTALNFPFSPRACTHACRAPSREMVLR